MERLRAENERRGMGDTLPGGASGVMVLADAENNRRMFVTTFETRDAIDQAEAVFEQMGNEIPEDVRGRRTSVGYYEVVFQR